MNDYQKAISKLHTRIIENHWHDDHLSGPDPIGKIHWRITRFVRSYLSFLPADDQYTYLQGMAYWIKCNLILYHKSGESSFLKIVRKAADFIVRTQPDNGAWRHPPIWGRKGFISTVEGVWASLGLVAAYDATGKAEYFEAAARWFKFQVEQIGFQEVGDGLAVNYYSHSTHLVPNVTTMFLRLSAELYNASKDLRYIDYSDRHLRFLEMSQLENGELPYVYPNRQHFMCFQYNAFQFMDLASFYSFFPEDRLRNILWKMSRFLGSGLTELGNCRYDCSHEFPEVNYWTGALAAALLRASEMELGDYHAVSERAYLHLISNQRLDGNFDFSSRNYRFLKDSRSYPRYLAMILFHILYRDSVKALNVGTDVLRSVAT